MATLKFKDPSPYVKGPQGAPPVDYLYARYLESIKMSSKEGNPQEKIQMALFGAGRAGSIHLSSMASNPRVTVRYVVDDDQSKWTAIKNYWHLDSTEFLFSKDSNRVFQDAGVQAVVVASPTVCHEETIRGALHSGKHVFCEKPVAQDCKRAERCYQLAAHCDRTLFCAFNRRFDPAYSLLKDRVRKGEVGHVQTIKVCSRDSPIPTIDFLRTSGGIFHDCAVHDIDIMCWVLGKYPHRVTAHVYAHTPEIAGIGDYDTVAVLLSFPSGTLGVIDLSRNSAYGYDQRLEANAGIAHRLGDGREFPNSSDSLLINHGLSLRCTDRYVDKDCIVKQPTETRGQIETKEFNNRHFMIINKSDGGGVFLRHVALPSKDNKGLHTRTQKSRHPYIRLIGGDTDCSSCCSFPVEQYPKVFGPRGMLTCNNERPMCGMESHIGLRGRLAEPIFFSFSSRYQLAYVNEMEHFLDVIHGKVALKVLGHETLAVSKIASACEESARSGQSVELTWKTEDLPPK